MATSTRLSAAARNAATDAVTATLGASGFLDIYSGTQPTNPDTAHSETLLAHLALSADAFGDSVAGVATANAISNDTSADNTGTASWFSLTTSGGTRKIEGSVGTATANLILATTAIVAGAIVSVTSLTYTTVLEAD